MRSQDRPSLWQYCAEERLRYGAALLALLISTGLTFGAPLLVRWAIDVADGESSAVVPRAVLDLGLAFGLDGRGPAVLLATGAGIVLLAALAGAAEYVRERLAARASEGIVRRVRNRLFARLERLPSEYHDASDTGDLVQRATSDVETLRVFLANQVTEIGRGLSSLLFVVPLLFWMDPALALVSLALYPLILLFALVFFRRIKGLFLATDEAEGRMTTALQENLTGNRVVRAFSQEDHERRRFAGANAAHRDQSRGLWNTLGVYWSLSDALCLTQIGAVLVYGAHSAQTGRISLGDLQAFLAYQALALWPARQLGRVLNDAGKAVVALGRMGEVLGSPEEPADGLVPAAGPGRIEARGLSFAFGEAQGVLDTVNLIVEPGETVVLVGPPGSGKSTILHLLCRLYEPPRGSLFVDGHDVRDLSLEALRRTFGVVLQEPFLYSRTLRDNLRVARPGATDRDLERACRAAAIHRAILDFPDGYDTAVGERGVTLSGGQRQRVALARALLAEAAVLLLDDALSAVDTDTEAEILGALAAREGRGSTVLVTHRLSAAREADRVYVFDGGRIVQAGTHAELVRRPGPYRGLWSLQNELELELAAPGRAEVRNP